MCDACIPPQVAALGSRRNFIKAGLGLAVAAGFAATAVAPALAQNASATPAALTGEDALKRLMEGNARYAANAPNERDFSAGRAARSQSQHPFASIVSCSDSRLAPELAFDQSAGDLFVVRVAGNFVNEDGLASLEFGTAVLKTPLIVVLGHSRCGAVSAAIDVVKNGTKLPGHLPALVRAIRPAVLTAQKAAPASLLEAATIANVKLNVAKLTRSTPVLSQRIKAKTLLVVGAVYDLETGKVTLV